MGGALLIESSLAFMAAFSCAFPALFLRFSAHIRALWRAGLFAAVPVCISHLTGPFIRRWQQVPKGKRALLNVDGRTASKELGASLFWLRAPGAFCALTSNVNLVAQSKHQMSLL